MRALVVALSLSLLSCAAASHEGAAPREPNARPVVQLVHARLPMPLELLAVHYWFNAYDPTTRRWERWELWQERAQVATSWGHIHRDLMSPSSGVGGGPPVVDQTFVDDDAARLIAVLHRPETYDDRDTYRAWPGPNSNTYVAWVLREANVSADLSPLAIGKDWRGFVAAGVTTTGTGLQFETPIVGVKVGILDGIEIHLLALTFGFKSFSPTLKTPLGALSLPD